MKFFLLFEGTRLTFPDLEAAKAYREREGLTKPEAVIVDSDVRMDSVKELKGNSQLCARLRYTGLCSVGSVAGSYSRFRLKRM